MIGWILIIILGAVLTVVGFPIFVRKHPDIKTIPKSTFLIGIFIPMLAASMYAETLITESLPGLTLLDIAAFYFIGMISGFFVALYLLRNEGLAASRR